MKGAYLLIIFFTNSFLRYLLRLKISKFGPFFPKYGSLSLWHKIIPSRRLVFLYEVVCYVLLWFRWYTKQKKSFCQDSPVKKTRKVKVSAGEKDMSTEWIVHVPVASKNDVVNKWYGTLISLLMTMLNTLKPYIMYILKILARKQCLALFVFISNEYSCVNFNCEKYK